MRRGSGGDSDRRACLRLRPHSDLCRRRRLLPATSATESAGATATHRSRPLEGLHPTVSEREVRAPAGQEGLRRQGGGAAASGGG